MYFTSFGLFSLGHKLDAYHTSFREALEQRFCSCNSAFPIPGIHSTVELWQHSGSSPTTPTTPWGTQNNSVPRAKAPVMAAHIRGNRHLSQSHGMRNLCSTNQKPDRAMSVPSCPGAAHTPHQPWMLMGSSGHSALEGKGEAALL